MIQLIDRNELAKNAGQNGQVSTISVQTMHSDIRREPSAFAENDGSGEMFQILLELH